MLTQFLIKYRNPIVIAAIACAVLSFVAGRSLEFDRSIENMFVANERTLSDYQQLKRTFGGNEIVLAVYSDPQIFATDGSGLKRCRIIQKRLAKVEGVKAVLSIDQPLPGSAIAQRNFLSERARRLFQGYTHGSDGETVAVVCMLFPQNETSIPRRTTVDGLRGIIHDLPDGLPPGHITGEPVLVVDGFRYVEEDGQRLARWSAILLGGTIVLCFRSLRWVLIPILVVQCSLIFTNGMLSLAGMKLSMVSSMLTAVVMVIAVATMVHVIVRFSESRSQGLTILESISRTFQLLAVPIFWACMTDAVGFLALTNSNVGPVRDFGIMMAIGAGMVLLSVFVIVPACALVLGSVDADPRAPWGQVQLNRRLRRSIGLIEKYPKRILAVIFVLSTIGISGMSQTEVETDFTKNFRQDSEIVVAYQKVEESLGGAGVCDIMIPAPEKLDWPFLNNVRKLTKDIDRGLIELNASLLFNDAGDQELTKSLSLADAVSTIFDLDSKPKMLQNPLTKSSLFAMEKQMPEFFRALYGVDPKDGNHYFRIMLRVPEQQSSQQKQATIERLRSLGRKHFPEAKITGYFVLLSNLIDSVLRDQWRTFAIALVGIGLTMWVAFRNLKLALIALVPNSLPILVVIGMMGWLRIFAFPDLKINIGVAMIAAVSMGLSIDSSIHYIISFQRARLGKTFREALEQVQQNVGRAMILSTLSLVVGFTVLATSQFVPTIYFGSMVSLAMLGGLLGNLVILPVLLKLFCQHDDRPSHGARESVREMKDIQAIE